MENRKLAIRVCLALMFLCGIIMSVMVPPWQSPDENAHLAMIGESFCNGNMAEQLMQDMPLDNGRIRFQYDEKISINDWKAAVTKTPGYSRAECLPKGLTLSVLKHLPAGLGVTLGILLHLPTFWVLELGELFSLIFYVAVCGLAVKLMPVKKEVLLLVMAFPMTLQQAASLNYDGVLLPLCFLYVAYIFYMRYEKESLGWKDVFCTILLLLFISYIKLPYIFLGLLVFILPKEKIHLWIGRAEINGEFIQKWRILLGIVLVLLVIAGGYVVRENFWVQLVVGMALEWKRTLYLFAATAYTWGKYLIISSVGQFGWLESSLPFGFAIFSYLLMLGVAVWGEGEEKPFQLNRRTKVYVWIVFIILSVLTVMSMVNHTIKVMHYGSEGASVEYDIREMLYEIPYIGGLQGRYFLPFLALPFLALPGKGKQIKWKPWLAAGYQITAMAITMVVLYKRYWIG